MASPSLCGFAFPSVRLGAGPGARGPLSLLWAAPLFSKCRVALVSAPPWAVVLGPLAFPGSRHTQAVLSAAACLGLSASPDTSLKVLPLRSPVARPSCSVSTTPSTVSPKEERSTYCLCGQSHFISL